MGKVIVTSVLRLERINFVHESMPICLYVGPISGKISLFMEEFFTFL